ncbi:TonB-dependent receptor [Ilyomonas limi]|uniref:TonB-dependent receptor n=1 Tax=Ilyomonas limi TaxID=2575867 RepID=A0A4U3LA58_9BACT|nr:TonB-dependent receptor [Ilyomonas limi]TKK72002.1 TonB-dependent receptor [Ilyomonas limi]
MKKVLLAIALQALSVAALEAQQIKGFVKDEQGNAVSDATVSLLKSKDSTVIKLALSQEGNFSFYDVSNDSLLISINYVGHQTFYSEKFSFVGEPIILPPFVLSKLKTGLQTVTVTARKKMVDVKGDRTILNIEGTINATGSDALELLKKSPGVNVDKDEKLSINGKNGVQVYIDNKPTPLNGQDLSSYLKSIPSAQIEAIEIINNPGVMYEASGSAGIINIRLKKNKTMGFNGSVNAGISASKNIRWEDGFSINYRNKRVNAYGTYSGNHGKLQSDFELHRVVKDTAFDQQSRIWMNKNNHTFKTGADYTVSAKSNIGVMVNGNIAAPEVTNLNITPISYYPTGAIDKILVAGNFTKQRNTNINSNINYSYKDTSGRTLVVNADYGYYNNKQDQVQPNLFFDATGKHTLYQHNYLIVSPARIDIYSVKADYEQRFAKGKLALGGKFGYVKTNNDFNQYNEAGNEWELDKDRSNFFGYKENVNAAYINYARELKGIAIQGGIRAEQTNVEGSLKGFKKMGSDYTAETFTFKKDYLDFFPSVSITIAPKSQNQFALSYSRRIDRPVYQDLNPFEYRINEYTYHKGSVDLRPQYTNTISLTHTFRYKLNTTLSYSHVKDVFGQLVDTAQGVKGYLVNSNIASQNITSLNISYPFQYKNFSLFTNVNTYYSAYKADFGADRNINLDVWAVHIYAQSSYRFGKGWAAEISGFYTSPAIWQGTLKTASMWSADAGVQKQIWKGKGAIKATVSDVFKTMKWRATSNFSGQDIAAAGRYDSRQFKINFTYRFGNQKLKAARQYKTGLEEESNRAQSSGGLGH